MDKYRLSVNISLRHYNLIKKHMKKYETQQKVIEAALENLNARSDDITVLSEEDKFRLKMRKTGAVCIISRDSYRVLLESLNTDDFKDYIAERKPLEFIMEVYYEKPLGDCSLTEVLDLLVRFHKIMNAVDYVAYTDDGDHYTIKIIHDMGINRSRMLKIFYESLFKTYGTYVNYTISERSLFIKIFKIIDDLS